MSTLRLPSPATPPARPDGLTPVEADLAHALVHARLRLRAGARPATAAVRAWEAQLTALTDAAIALASRGDFRAYVRATRLCELFYPLAVAVTRRRGTRARAVKEGGVAGETLVSPAL